jgi:hypothetical protein
MKLIGTLLILAGLVVASADPAPHVPLSTHLTVAGFAMLMVVVGMFTLHKHTKDTP